ncbi:MAG: Mth938-like domain-containing protein [Deltaproteobacteria bacterium]|nr:Mth938-like domain-containing protein [Deltaproteobacteria bacterium]MBW2072666.1 Mth938-like domain-containing protein [Deltaproteobacteria bacterium]
MIDSYSFGRMIVKGETHNHDLKIIGNQTIGNWWRQRGHALLPQDIADILDSQVDIIVIGMGEPGHMQVTDEAARAIAARGMEFIALPTREAVARFNSLKAAGKKVAGAFHLTC